MKLLYALAIVALIMAVAVRPNVEEQAEEQIHHSEIMCDSAAMVLEDIRKVNDSLLVNKYFYNDGQK
jgi:membrane protein implicated in regulation of membrane protease activity